MSPSQQSITAIIPYINTEILSAAVAAHDKGNGFSLPALPACGSLYAITIAVMNNASWIICKVFIPRSLIVFSKVSQEVNICLNAKPTSVKFCALNSTPFKVNNKNINDCRNSLIAGFSGSILAFSHSFANGFLSKVSKLIITPATTPQITKVQFAPCQSPHKANTIKVFIIFLAVPFLLPPKGM